MPEPATPRLRLSCTCRWAADPDNGCLSKALVVIVLAIVGSLALDAPW